MKVIGVVGLNGSGKDELVHYLHERCGVDVYSTGDIVRQIANKEAKELSRPSLQNLSRRYMDSYGHDYFVRQVIERIERDESGDAAAITGIRTPEDVDTLKARFGHDFILVYVRVPDPYLRYQRIRRRGEPRDPNSYEEFLRQQQRENQFFDIPRTISEADITIDNSAELPEFHRKIEHVLIQPLASELGCESLSNMEGADP